MQESWIRCCKVRPTWATVACQLKGRPAKARIAASGKASGEGRPNSRTSLEARHRLQRGLPCGRATPGLGQGGIAAPR